MLSHRLYLVDRIIRTGSGSLKRISVFTADHKLSRKRHLLGFGSAFACAVLIGLMYLVLRKVGSDIHYTVMSFYYSLVGVISLGFVVLMTSGFSIPCQVTSFFRPKLRFLR